MTDVLHVDTVDTERVALLGGVYSNHLALERALVDARARGADRVFCLGDLGAFGPHPDRVFPLLKDHEVTTLKGNYDDSVARGLADCQCGYTDPRDNYFARLSYRYTLHNTSADNRAWMGTLPGAIRFRFGRQKILLCHGSPRRINEFLWESTTPDQFLEKIFDDFDADIVAATHTGIKWTRTLPSGRTFVNVGVVGRPENDGRRQVWYTTLERNRDARGKTEGAEGVASPAVNVSFIPVEYDDQRLAHEMRAERLPAEFVETIETGWWTTCLEILPAKERLRGKW